MRVALHCNLPFIPDMPHPGLGSLKAFLRDHGFPLVTIHYWNVLPADLELVLSRICAALAGWRREDVLALIARLIYVEDHEGELGRMAREIPAVNEAMRGLLCHFVRGHQKFVERKITAERPFEADVIGFSMTEYQWAFQRLLYDRLECVGEQEIILGGARTREQAVEFMRLFPRARACTWGEGEVALLALLRGLRDGRKLLRVPSVAFRDKNGIRTTREIRICELPQIDDIPPADHSDFFATRAAYGAVGDVTIPVGGSRSCAWNRCVFCFHTPRSSRSVSDYREGRVDRIGREIEFQRGRHGTNRFLLLDSSLGRKSRKTYHEQLDVLLRLVESVEGEIEIHRAEIWPHRLDRGSVRKLAATCCSVQIGFEAMTDRLLGKLGKAHCFAHNVQALRYAHDAGLPLRSLNVLRNLPSELAEDVEESIANLKFLRFYLDRFDSIRCNRIVVTRETDLYADLSDEDVSKLTAGAIFWEQAGRLPFAAEIEVGLLGYFTLPDRHDELWSRFAGELQRWRDRRCHYSWSPLPGGGSIVREYEGHRQVAYRFFDSRRTRIMRFCDRVRRYGEIRQIAGGLAGDELDRFLLEMRNSGYLYCQVDLTGFLVSTISAGVGIAGSEARRSLRSKRAEP